MGKKRAPTFEQRRQLYRDLWSTMKIRPSKEGRIDWHVSLILKNRDRYQRVENICGVPWWFVGLVHAMEASYRFDKHLHNGDALTGRTWRVPKGRIPGLSPPYSWEVSAEDALKMKGFHRYSTWRIDEVCYRLEMYNGWGYALYRNHYSPYLWSYTSHYTIGKYEFDGDYNPHLVSKQAGAIAILKRLSEAVPSIAAQIEPESVVGLPPRPVDSASEEPDDDPEPQPKAERERPTGKEMSKSRKWNLLNWFKWIGGLLGFTSVGVNLSSASGVTEVVHYGRAIQTLFLEWGLFGVTGLCIVIVLIAVTVQEWMKDDVEDERYKPSGGQS